MALRRQKKQTPAQPPVVEPEASVSVTDVFTPSVPAGRGFVGRETEMQDLVSMGLRVPGTQVIVWGESGAGKSSLINKALATEGQTAVKTACTPDSTYEDILAAAFSGTGAFYVTESTEHTDATLAVAGTIGSELIGSKVTAEAELNKGTGLTRQPIARPQLSPQRLVAELGARGYSWVIEDFHKVTESERARIAHALKVFSDDGAKYPSTRVIVLGVSESVDELVQDSINISKRIIDIEVPPLDHGELGKILDVGQNLLNLDFSRIRTQLLDTAVGTASIAHALALACCLRRKVTQPASDTVTFTAKDFEAATQQYARTRSSALKSRFKKALKVHRKRTYDNTEIILRALTQLPESGGTVGEILAVIRRDHPKYPSGNATSYLRQLQEEERGSLIRKTSFGVYRFDEPLQHAYARSYFGYTSDATDTAAATTSKYRLTASAWEEVVKSTLVVTWSSLREEIVTAREEMTEDDQPEAWELEENTAADAEGDEPDAATA